MTLPAYFGDVARGLRAESDSISRDFRTHRLSSGENREDAAATFLMDHLPKRFGVGRGLVVSSDGVFSSQADLLIVDRLNNSPLYGASRNQLWPVESVYALLEVKSGLNPDDIADAIAKGRRFKDLRREFSDASRPRIADSLFVIWAFESPAAATFKVNFLDALRDVPRSEQPDLVIVPNSLVARAGSYLEISELGQPGSQHRRDLEAKHGSEHEKVIVENASVYELGENSLLGWYVWLHTWLQSAGPRMTTLTKYLPPGAVFGRRL